jgi:hypothetical protein
MRMLSAFAWLLHTHYAHIYSVHSGSHKHTQQGALRMCNKHRAFSEPELYSAEHARCFVPLVHI